MTARLAATIALLFWAGAALAQATVDVYLFWRIGCPRCEQAIAFLDRLAAQQPVVRLHKLEVSGSRANASLMVRVADRFGIEAGSVPLTVIGERVWTGYRDDASTGAELKAEIEACLARACPDRVSALESPVKAASMLPATISLPLVGEVRTADLSLPGLTVLLAAADGFNPCAMWVLVFLLGVLAGMRDRTRMWLLGGTFIAASAAVYLLVLTAWLNILLYVGALSWVRVAVGMVALATGVWYLREHYLNRAPVCEVTAPEKRRRVFERLKALALERDFLLAFVGIALLAVAVNFVEFLCSAGIPAVFTQVLALANLSAWQYAAYLLLYVLVFMADDLVVLFAALRTLEATGLTTTYARWSSLVGGLVLVALGAVLIGRPKWLALG